MGEDAEEARQEDLHDAHLVAVASGGAAQSHIITTVCAGGRGREASL